MKKALQYFWIFFLSLITCIVIMPLRGGFVTILGLIGFPLSIVAYFIAYSFLTVFLLKKYGNTLKVWGIVLAILLGAINIELYLRVFRFEIMLISLPDLIARILTIFIGLCYYKMTNLKAKIGLYFLSSLMFVSFSYFGFSFWLHKINHGTFTGKTEKVTMPDKFQFSDETGKLLTMNDFKGQYVILDFWHSKCGVCFQTFPKIQDAYEYYKEREDVRLLSVFCYHERWEETSSDGARILKEKGYSFPCVSVNMKDEALKIIGVNVYPTVIVVNKIGEVIYKGGFEGAHKYVTQLIEKEK